MRRVYSFLSPLKVLHLIGESHKEFLKEICKKMYNIFGDVIETNLVGLSNCQNMREPLRLMMIQVFTRPI